MGQRGVERAEVQSRNYLEGMGIGKMEDSYKKT